MYEVKLYILRMVPKPRDKMDRALRREEKNTENKAHKVQRDVNVNKGDLVVLAEMVPGSIMMRCFDSCGSVSIN